MICPPHVRFPRVQVATLKLYVRLMCNKTLPGSHCHLYRDPTFILNGFVCVRFLSLSVLCFLVVSNFYCNSSCHLPVPSMNAILPIYGLSVPHNWPADASNCSSWFVQNEQPGDRLAPLAHDRMISLSPQCHLSSGYF